MNRVLAALIFFTRLPFWRIAEVPSAYFKRVVPWWPMVGWLTSGIMVAVLWISAQLFPLSVAWLLSIVSRLLVTGALHEDGLADFCDGFGGGTTRERVLSIMKDSHIGTYGVIGLVVYFLLLTQMSALPLGQLCATVFVGDCWAKMCASRIINRLPYCRKEEEAKIKATYEKMTLGERCISIFFGVLPALLCFRYVSVWGLLLALAVSDLLIWLMRRRIGGYTGDCCGATFLLTELTYFLTCLVTI